jgi:asparagine synthase (glutamine-hydrolysing)
MCGIFGQIGAPLPPDQVAAVQAVLHHRGPESSGVHAEGLATLVHTRLRILDLSPAGAQPMANEDGSVWLTFNGEIYNFAELRAELTARGHRFRSRADTEVLVHGYEEWGDHVVERIDGMFAFGLWDARKRRLLCARDRAGKKPLYYTRQGERFQFASEIKALFAAGTPLAIDADAIPGFLAYGYVPPPDTFYAGIEQLPPASRLVLELGAPPVVDCYWRLDFTPRAEPVDEDEAAERVRALTAAAVKKRLVADVPVGAFLSGGVDSTVVVGLMAEAGQRVRTFSIGFHGDPRYDETAFARIAARRFDTAHEEFRVEPKQFDLTEKLIWHHDGPFGDSSAVPTYLVSQLTRAHVTVALNGDGGDELFAGYLRFWAAALSERVPRPLRVVGGALARALPGGLPERGRIARTRRFLRAAGMQLGDRLTVWNSYFAFELDRLLRPEAFSPGRTAEVLGFHRRFFPARPEATPLALALTHNFHTYLPYDLLPKMDRTSMAHALETRSPFLDTALLEYVAGLPDSFKLRGRTSKYILRRACRDLLPQEIQRRGKMGFGMPLGTWFRGDLQGYVRDHLLAPGARIADFVRQRYVDRLVEDHIAERADHGHQLWALLTLELWLRNLGKLTRPWGQA